MGLTDWQGHISVLVRYRISVHLDYLWTQENFLRLMAKAPGLLQISIHELSIKTLISKSSALPKKSPYGLQQAHFNMTCYFFLKVGLKLRRHFPSKTPCNPLLRKYRSKIPQEVSVGRQKNISPPQCFHVGNTVSLDPWYSVKDFLVFDKWRFSVISSSFTRPPDVCGKSVGVNFVAACRQRNFAIVFVTAAVECVIATVWFLATRDSLCSTSPGNGQNLTSM